MRPNENVTYRLESRADTSRSLNVYGTTPKSLANVCLYKSDDNDICQQWLYEKKDGHEYLVCKGNSNLVLDLFTGSSSVNKVKDYNAHVYTRSNTAYLEFEETTDGYVRICLADSSYPNKYLTANQGSNGTSGGKDVRASGTVYFYAGGLTDYSQDWKLIPLNGGTTPDPVPGNGQKLRLPINGDNCLSASRNTSSTGAYALQYGQPHYGGDIACANGTTLKGLGVGKVVGANWNDTEGYYVSVRYNSCIPVNGNSVTDIVVRYFHMKSLNVDVNDDVTISTILGYSGNTGAWAFKANHVHIEVDRDTEHPNYTPSIPASRNGGDLMAGNDLTCENPFDWFYTYSGQTKSRYWDSDETWVFPEDMENHPA